MLAVAAVVLGLVLIAAPAAIRAASAKPEVEAPAPPPGTFQPTPEQWRAITFAPAHEMSFADQVSTEGRIATDDDVTVQVTPPFSGRVIAVPVKAGDVVAKGEVLLTAEASEVAQARADLASARLALDTAKSQAALAAVNATRALALFKINGAALRDVQQAQNDAAAAQNTARTDTGALALVEDRLKVLEASGGGSGAQAALRSPISGVVLQRQVGPGQYVNATANGATTPIFSISDMAKVWLVANVAESDAARLKLGDLITVKVAGLPGRSFRGRIDYVAAALDPVTRRLPVHATVANPQGLLKPEMFADFALDTGPADEALGVPASAVIYEGDAARVWVAGPGHALGLRQIKAGRTQDGEVEVLGGLQPGDQVATSGAIFIDRAANPG